MSSFVISFKVFFVILNIITFNSWLRAEMLTPISTFNIFIYLNQNFDKLKKKKKHLKMSH